MSFHVPNLRRCNFHQNYGLNHLASLARTHHIFTFGQMLYLSFDGSRLPILVVNWVPAKAPKGGQAAGVIFQIVLLTVVDTGITGDRLTRLF